MAKKTVIKKTPNLDRLEKKLKNPEIGLKEGALYVASTARTRWKRGNGLDNIPMKPLSAKYAEQKKAGVFKNQVNTSGKPDLLLTGKMQNKFGIEKQSKTSYKVGWGDAKEQTKADKNHDKRPNMLKVTDKLARKVTKIFNEWMKK
jgi:hypothetical protein